MTYEQWVLYLYSIYPGDGALFLLGTVLTFVWIYWLYFFLAKSEGLDSTVKTIQQFGRIVKIKTVTVVALILLVVFSLIPSKDMFLVIIGTSTIVNIVKDIRTTKKLNDISKIIDITLEHKIKDLKEKK